LVLYRHAQKYSNTYMQSKYYLQVVRCFLIFNHQSWLNILSRLMRRTKRKCIYPLVLEQDNIKCTTRKNDFKILINFFRVFSRGQIFMPSLIKSYFPRLNCTPVQICFHVGLQWIRPLSCWKNVCSDVNFVII